MNIRDLKYLIALDQHKHFGKAADASFVSQPALSMQIKKLEEFFGVALIERQNKSFIFTAFGNEILHHARKVLREVDDMKALAESTKDPESGQFKLGIIPTLAPYLLPLIIPKLNKRFKKVTFYLIEAQTKTLIEQLKNGEVDAALLALPNHEPLLEEHAVFTEPFLLAVSTQHPLHKLKKINASQLCGENIMLLEEGHCLRDQALTFCQQSHLSESQDFRATSLETLKHMTAANVGVTLVPELACKPQKNLVFVPFAKPAPERIVGLVARQSSAKKQLLKNLVSELREIISP